MHARHRAAVRRVRFVQFEQQAILLRTDGFFADFEPSGIQLLPDGRFQPHFAKDAPGLHDRSRIPTRVTGSRPMAASGLSWEGVDGATASGFVEGVVGTSMDRFWLQPARINVSGIRNGRIIYG